MAKMTIVALALLAVCVASLAEQEQPIPRIDGAKILMVIASRRFRDEELIHPRELFLKQGALVKVASSSLKEAEGMLGAKFKPEVLITDVKPEDFDAIVFVGGAGAAEYWDSRVAHTLAKKAFEQKRIVAAICVAPVTLARAGLLKERKATVWKSEAPQLEKAGAMYTAAPVQVDGRIITADGPKSAKLFAAAVVTAIEKNKKPDGGDLESQDSQQERSD